MSKRNFASLFSTMTQSSNRLRKVPTRSRPTCSQTETSALSVLNVSVASVFPAKCHWQRSQRSHDTSFYNFMKYSVDIQFFRHVVLSNGTTMFQRIVDRSCPVLTVVSLGRPQCRWFLVCCCAAWSLGRHQCHSYVFKSLDVNRESRSRCGLSCGTNLFEKFLTA